MKKSVTVLLINNQNLILGVSRKDDPNAWGLPGGSVEEGETEEYAVQRECKEETGLDITNPVKVFEDICEGKVDYLNSCFTANYDESQGFSTKEKGVVKWVQSKEIVNGPFGTYNIKLFQKLDIYFPKIEPYKMIVKVKDFDSFSKMCFKLKIDSKTINKYLLCGEYGIFEIIIDRDLNVVGGKLGKLIPL